jgi:hypothetical protein
MPAFLPASGGYTYMSLINAYLGKGNDLGAYLSQTFYRSGVGNVTLPAGPIGMNDTYSMADYWYGAPVISTPTADFNLNTWATSAGWDGSRKVVIVLTNNSYLYASSTGTYALTLGTWPAGSEITFINNAYVQGCGGAGGDAVTGTASGGNGGAGGPAMYLQYYTLIYNYGAIWAGGGGGGAGGAGGSFFSGTYGSMGAGGGGGGYSYAASAGGSGAGTSWGGLWVGMSNGANGTNGGTMSAGSGGNGGTWVGNGGAGGAGGTPGAAGSAGAAGNGNFQNYGGGSGGAAGYYAIGSGNIGWAVVGDVRGQAG